MADTLIVYAFFAARLIFVIPMLSVIALEIFVLSILFRIVIFANPTGLFFASTTLIETACCWPIEKMETLKNNKRNESLNMEGIEKNKLKCGE
jgi:hypothetical protein